MYTDRPEWVEFIADSLIIDHVIDWFGKDARISKYGDDEKQIKVAVRVSPMAMEHWAMQYAKYVEVTAPQHLRERIRASLEKATEHYRK